MSRIVQSLMPYREQVTDAEFVSIEECLGRNTAAYYEVLARVDGGRWSPDRDASEWVEFVLTAHRRRSPEAPRCSDQIATSRGSSTHAPQASA